MSKGGSKVVFDIPIDSSKRPVPESQVGPHRARLSALLCSLRRPISRVSFQLASSTAAKAKAGDGMQTVRVSSHSLPIYTAAAIVPRPHRTKVVLVIFLLFLSIDDNESLDDLAPVRCWPLPLP